MLTPIHLKLVNCGIHSEAEISYVSGITGVIGNNGTGKSVLSHLGPMYGLTGILPPDYRKEDILKWGESKGHIQFTFKCDDIEYTVVRNTHNPTTELTWEENGQKQQLTKASVVNPKIESLLGIPLKVFAEISFIPQGKLNHIIELDHSKRLTLFQRLTGTLKADALRSLLQVKLNSSAMELYAVTQEELDEFTETIGLHNKDLIEKKKALKGYTDILNQLKGYQNKIETTLAKPTEAVIEAKLITKEALLSKLQTERSDLLLSNNIAKEVSECFITPKEFDSYNNYKSYKKASEELELNVVVINCSSVDKCADFSLKTFKALSVSFFSFPRTTTCSLRFSILSESSANCLSSLELSSVNV